MTRAVFAPLELGEPPAEDPPTVKVAADKVAEDQADPAREEAHAAQESLFAEGLAADKVPVGRVTAATPAPAATAAAAAAGTGTAAGTAPTVPPPSAKSDAVRLDDSLERLIVSEDTHKP